MSMDNLLKKAQAMREKQQRELAQMRAGGKGGGGSVAVKMDGHKHLRSISIDPAGIDPENLEPLARQVIEAVNEATDKMEVILVRKFGPSSGIPDLL